MPQESYSEGVAQDHRRDARKADLVAPLPEGVLEGLGGRHRSGGSSYYELRGLVFAPLEVAPQGLYGLFREEAGARGEVGAGAAKLYLGGVEV